MELTKMPISFNLTENSYLKSIYKEGWRHYLVTPSGKVEVGIDLLQRFASKELIDKDVVQMIVDDK